MKKLACAVPTKDGAARIETAGAHGAHEISYTWRDCASAPLPTLQERVLLRRRHRLLQPSIDHRGDLLVVLLLHHHMAVALDAQLRQPDEIGLDAGLLQELDRAVIIR